MSLGVKGLKFLSMLSKNGFNEKLASINDEYVAQRFILSFNLYAYILMSFVVKMLRFLSLESSLGSIFCQVSMIFLRIFTAEIFLFNVESASGGPFLM